LAKTNYSFEKRQRELDKKRKHEEKRLRKQDGNVGGDQPADSAAPVDDAGSDVPPGSDPRPLP
jgi:hypothetical protein